MKIKGHRIAELTKLMTDIRDSLYLVVPENSSYGTKEHQVKNLEERLVEIAGDSFFSEQLLSQLKEAIGMVLEIDEERRAKIHEKLGE